MWLSDQVYLDDETVDDSGVFILDILKITFSRVAQLLNNRVVFNGK